MVGSLGDGLLALRELARKRRGFLPEKASLQQRLYEELTAEAGKFFVFRGTRSMILEQRSLYRVRCLCEMLKYA